MEASEFQPGVRFYLPGAYGNQGTYTVLRVVERHGFHDVYTEPSPWIHGFLGAESAVAREAELLERMDDGMPEDRSRLTELQNITLRALGRRITAFEVWERFPDNLMNDLRDCAQWVSNPHDPPPPREGFVRVVSWLYEQPIFGSRIVTSDPDKASNPDRVAQYVYLDPARVDWIAVLHTLREACSGRPYIRNSRHYGRSITCLTPHADTWFSFWREREQRCCTIQEHRALTLVDNLALLRHTAERTGEGRRDLLQLYRDVMEIGHAAFDAYDMCWRAVFDRPTLRSHRQLVEQLENLGVWVSCSGCGERHDNCSCTSISMVRMSERFSFDAEPSPEIPRFVGAELEICGFDEDAEHVSNLVSQLGGGVKYDGSLPDGGREIVLPPTRGVEAVEMFRDVTAALRDADAWVNERAGGHVHVDTRNLTHSQHSAFLALWWALEQPVADLLCPDRLDNEFSTGLEPRPIPREELLQTLTSDLWRDPGAVFDLNPKGERYVAVNFLNCAIRCGEGTITNDRGTIEFRLWPGVIGFDRLYAHASMSSKLVHHVVSFSPEEIARQVAEYAHNRDGLLEAIVGSDLIEHCKALPVLRDEPRYYRDDTIPATRRNRIAA